GATTGTVLPAALAGRGAPHRVVVLDLGVAGTRSSLRRCVDRGPGGGRRPRRARHTALQCNDRSSRAADRVVTGAGARVLARPARPRPVLQPGPPGREREDSQEVRDQRAGGGDGLPDRLGSGPPRTARRPLHAPRCPGGGNTAAVHRARSGGTRPAGVVARPPPRWVRRRTWALASGAGG